MTQYLYDGYCWPDNQSLLNHVDSTPPVISTTGDVLIGYAEIVDVNHTLIFHLNTFNANQNFSVQGTTSVFQTLPTCANVGIEHSFDVSQLDPVDVVNVFSGGFIISFIPFAAVFGVSLVLKMIRDGGDG